MSLRMMVLYTCSKEAVCTTELSMMATIAAASDFFIDSLARSGINFCYYKHKSTEKQREAHIQYIAGRYGQYGREYGCE